MSMGQIQLEADELWQQLVRITNDYTLGEEYLCPRQD